MVLILVEVVKRMDLRSILEISQQDSLTQWMWKVKGIKNDF